MAIPNPTKTSGEALKSQTAINLTISGPGNDCWATVAEKILPINTHKSILAARSISLSPFSSIRSIMEYFELRIFVAIANSASDIERDDAFLGWGYLNPLQGRR